jgi:hypothetical protein
MRYILILLLIITNIYAKGVLAGTVIQNIATLDFVLNEKRHHIKSNIEKSIVDQILDVKVSWMDIDEVSVTDGEKRSVLTFSVLNSGNGIDSFELFAKELEYKSDFQIKNIEIYLDRNSNSRLDSEDVIKKSLTIEPDGQKRVFVVSDVKRDADVSNGAKCYISLKAVSKTGGSGERGKIYRKKGVKGVDAVDGLSGGIGEDEGIYRFLKANLVLKKRVIKRGNGVLTVELDITAKGEGVVKNVQVVDEINRDTAYINESMSLDDQALTDKKDGDKGYYDNCKGDDRAKIFFDIGDIEVREHHIARYNLRLRRMK